MKIKHESDYARRRKAEGPPVEDYLDAQVKKASPDAATRAAGEAQERAYLEGWLAVKAKFPKRT